MSNELKKWLKNTAIKALKTMAETAAGLLTVGAVMSDVNWVVVGSASLLAGIYTILMNVASIQESEE